jgi:hypothetical protein
LVPGAGAFPEKLNAFTADPMLWPALGARFAQ